MKKLFLLTLTMFLFGCDPVEQDTRLICDCETRKIDYYEGLSITSSNLEENSTSNKIYSTPTETHEEPCGEIELKMYQLFLMMIKNLFFFQTLVQIK